MNRHFFQRKHANGLQVQEEMLTITSQRNENQNHNMTDITLHLLGVYYQSQNTGNC